MMEQRSDTESTIELKLDTNALERGVVSVAG